MERTFGTVCVGGRIILKMRLREIGCVLRWWDMFIEDVTIELLEGMDV
jgi:hypothetical protein